MVTFKIIEAFAQMRNIPIYRVRCIAESVIVSDNLDIMGENQNIPYQKWGGLNVVSTSDYLQSVISAGGSDMIYVNNINFYSTRETTQVRYGWLRTPVDVFNGVFTKSIQFYQPRGGNSSVYAQIDYYYLSVIPDLS